MIAQWIAIAPVVLGVALVRWADRMRADKFQLRQLWLNKGSPSLLFLFLQFVAAH
jgi:hypothetical protein